MLFLISTRKKVLANLLSDLCFEDVWIHIYLQDVPHFDHLILSNEFEKWRAIRANVGGVGGVLAWVAWVAYLSGWHASVGNVGGLLARVAYLRG